MRKLLFVLLIAILIPKLALAQETNNDNKILIYSNPMSESEKQAERERQVKAHLKKLNLNEDYKVIFEDEIIHPFNDPSDYKHEYGTSKRVIAKGFAGNQPSGGMKFPTGGGFYYSEDGGPTVSISVSFPEPFDSASVSINLGKRATSGYFVNVPNNYDYFKLYVEKEYEVTPYIIYKKQWNEMIWDFEWVKWSGGYTKIHMSTTAYAKKV